MSDVMITQFVYPQNCKANIHQSGLFTIDIFAATSYESQQWVDYKGKGRCYHLILCIKGQY
jgi:hypothetical protein